MMRSLWTSKTGMEAQQTQLDAISNNLANSATNGYKKSHVVFEDLMYQNIRQAGANSSEQTTLPTGLQVGLGTRASTARRSSTASGSRHGVSSFAPIGPPIMPMPAYAPGSSGTLSPRSSATSRHARPCAVSQSPKRPGPSLREKRKTATGSMGVRRKAEGSDRARRPRAFAPLESWLSF